jgi:hypothetical protein
MYDLKKDNYIFGRISVKIEISSDKKGNVFGD